MKTFSLLALLAAMLLTGCAHNYVITLNNGTQVGAKGRPRLENGSYKFTDATGQPSSVPAGRVAQIEPAGQAKNSKKFGFINSN